MKDIFLIPLNDHTMFKKVIITYSGVYKLVKLKVCGKNDTQNGRDNLEVCFCTVL